MNLTSLSGIVEYLVYKSVTAQVDNELKRLGIINHFNNDDNLNCYRQQLHCTIE